MKTMPQPHENSMIEVRWAIGRPCNRTVFCQTKAIPKIGHWATEESEPALQQSHGNSKLVGGGRSFKALFQSSGKGPR